MQSSSVSSSQGSPRIRRSSQRLRKSAGSAILPLAASITSALALGTFSASAATVSFTGPGTTWNQGADWSSTLTPQLTDDLLFSAAVATTLDASFSVQSLSFNTGSGTVSIDANSAGTAGQTLTLTGDASGSDALGNTGMLLDLGSSMTGTVNIGTTAGVGTTTVALGASGAFNIANASAALNFGANSVISGAFNLSQSGAGTLILAGANTFGGTTNSFTLNNGTLDLNNASALGNAANTFVINGGTIDNTSGAAISTSNYKQTWGGNFTFGGSNALNLGTGAVTLTGNRTVTINGTGALTVGGVISGAFGLTKAGNGTLTLNGANTYSGATTVNAGTIVVGPSSTLYGGGYKDAANAIVINQGATVSFSGWGYGTAGGFGALDDHNQDRSVNGGTIVYTGAGYTASASYRSDWVVGTLGATFDSESTGGGAWGWGVRTSGAFNSGYDDINMQGTVILTGSSNGDMQKVLTGNGGLTKSGSGTWTLGYSQSNAGTHDNTYAGDTTINNGTLKLRATGFGAPLPSGSAKGNVIINSPGSLDLNSRSVTINGLSGGGTVTSSAAGAVTLTVGANDQTSTFSGIIQNGSGTVALSKSGAGMLTLSGANTYTGITAITAGTLALSGSGAIASNTITVASGATFDVSALPGFSLGAGKTLTAGSTSSSGNDIVGNLASASGTINIAGTSIAGTLTVNGALTLNGGTVAFDLGSVPGAGGGNDLINAGSLNLSSPTSLAVTLNGALSSGIYTLFNYTGSLTGSLSNLTLSVAAARQTLTLGSTGASNGSVTLTVAGNPANLTWLGDGTSNAWNQQTTKNFLNGGTADYFYNGDNVTFDDTGSGSPAVAITGTLSPASVTVNNTANAYTFAGTGSIAGVTALTKSGNNSLTISNANTYTGGTTISAGQISINNASALGTGPIVFAGGNIDNTSGGAITLSTNNAQTWSGDFTFGGSNALNLGAGAVTLTGNRTVTVNGTGALTVGGVISGAFGLTKAGNGTLTLNGANTYTGTTTVNAGTIVVGPNSTLYGGGYKDVANAIVINPGATVTFSGWGYGIAGGFGQLDDHNQDRVVNGGTIVYTGVGGGTAYRSDWVVGTFGATFDSEATGGGTWAWGVASGQFNSGYDDINMQGAVILTGSSNGDMQKALTGNGGLTKNGTGTWTLGYSQTNAGTHDNTYAGDTTINSGTLKLRATGLGAPLPSGSGKGNVIINSPGILDLNSRSVTINGLSGGGTVTSSSAGAVTLTVGANNQTSTFSGIIQNGSGTVALTKTGTGTLTLNGAATYSGPTTINAGTLALAGTVSLASASITVAPGAVLDASALTLGGLSLGAGQSLTAGTVSGTGIDIVGNISVGTGSLTIGGTGAAGTLTLNGNLTLNGTTINVDLASSTTVGNGVNDLVSVGGLTLSGPTTLSLNTLNGFLANGTYTLFTYSGSFSGNVSNLSATINGKALSTTRASYTFGTSASSAGALTLTVSGGASLIWAGDGTSNVWDITTTANFLNNGSRDVYYQGDTVTFNDSGSNSPAIAISGTLLPGAVTVNNSATAYTFGGTGSIAGGGALTKSGNGSLSITNANSYTGGTTLNAGQLNINNASALGTGTLVLAGGTIDNTSGAPITLATNNAQTWSGDFAFGGTNALNLGTGAVSLTGNRTVTTSGSGALTVGGIISGAFGLTKAGNGTLILTAANTYTGTTTVNGGTLQVDTGGAVATLGSGPVTIGSGGTLAFLRADTSLTISNAFSGTGALAFNGTGVSGQSSYVITGSNNGFSGTITANNARVTASNASGLEFGTGSLVATGGGEFYLTGGTFNDNFSIAGQGWTESAGKLGAIRLGGGAIVNGSVTLTGAATISAYGSSGQINGPIQETGGSQNLTLGVAGSASTLTLNGVSTYTGTTTITNATVTLNGSLASSAVTVSDGSTLGGHGGITGSLTLGATTGATLSVNAATPGALSVGGNLVLKGTDTIAFAPGATMPIGSPYTLLTYGGSLTGSTANLALANASTYRQAVITAGGGAITLDIGAKALTWTGTPTATWDINTTSSFVDNTATAQNFFAGDAVTFDDSSTNNIVTLNGALSPSSLVVNNSVANYVFNSGTSGSIAGGAKLVKTGTGILVINLANTFSGGATISTGEVRISNAGALGTGAVTLGDAFTGANNVNLYLDTNRVSFANPVVVTGNGNVTIGSRSTVGGTGANGYSNIVLQGNVTFDSNASDRTDYTIASGAGDVTITGTGRTIFPAANTFLGNITVATATGFQIGVATPGNTNIIPDTSSVTVQSGALMRMSSGGEAIDALNGAGTINVNAINSILTVGASNGSGTFSGVLADSGNTLGLTKAGTGTETLSGTSNTYSGPTVVNGGTLQITGSIAGSAVTVNSGGTLVVAGTASGSSATMSGGTLSIPSGGTLNDTLTVTSGTVQVAGSLSGSTAAVNGGSLISAQGSTIGGAVTVGGGLLGGGGLVSGAVTINNGGTLAPGQNASGYLTLNNGLALNSGGHLALTLDGTGLATQYAPVLLSGGAVTLGGDLQLTLGYTPTVGDVFFAIVNQAGGTVGGTFSNAVDQGNGTGLFSTGGYNFLVSYSADFGSGAFGVDQGQDVALEVIAAVPEPCSAIALLGGLGTLVGLQRFRRRF